MLTAARPGTAHMLAPTGAGQGLVLCTQLANLEQHLLAVLNCAVDMKAACKAQRGKKQFRHSSNSYQALGRLHLSLQEISAVPDD